MTYRHLEVKRTEELITEVEKFVKVLLILLISLTYAIYVNEQNVIGKKYKINAGKIFKQKSAIAEKVEADQLNTFFCSELVAACYKKLGLLPKEISCATYWPGKQT